MRNRRAFGVRDFSLQLEARRPRSLGGFNRVGVPILLIVAASSCSGRASDGSTEVVKSSSQPLIGGFNDVDSPESNTVVKIGGGDCTGTLVTPKLVLTAAHCIIGIIQPDGENQCFNDTRPSIGVGAGPGPTFTTRQGIAAATRPTGCVTSDPDETGIDFGLVYLEPLQDPGSSPQVASPFIEGVAFVRPSFQKPGGNDLIGVAGYSSQGGPNRQVRIFSNLNVQDNQGDPDSPPGYYWTHSGSDITTQNGDSGGPLFIATPNGNQDPYTWTRDVIGVLHGFGGDTTYWADITSGGNADWVRQFALDANANCGDGGLHRQCRHTDKWLAQHAKVKDDFWYGEVDYVGNPADHQITDFDGDHWLNDHDNCPFVANTDQTDSNDDGIGDACSLCPCDPNNDPDGDGVCGPSCTPGVFGCPQQCGSDPNQRVDNCVNVPNNDQANCNEFSEQTLALPILGDACDPVPCPTSSSTGVVSGPDGCSGQPYTGYFCQGRHVQNQVFTHTVGVHVLDAPPTKIASEEYEVHVPQTDARFCQTATTPVIYNCKSQNAIRDKEANFFSSYAMETATPTHPWHRVTISGTTPNLNREGSFVWNYGAPSGFDPTQDTTETWNYLTDAASWIADGKIPPPDLTLYPGCNGSQASGTCLDGTFWMHANTDYGNTIGTLPVNNTVVDIGKRGPDLASRFFDLRPDEAYFYHTNGVGAVPRVRGFTRIAPDPYDGTMARRVNVLVTSAQTGGAYSLQANGSGIDVSLLLPQRLVGAVLDTTVNVISPVEPSDSLGVLNANVLGVALSLDGTQTNPITRASFNTDQSARNRALVASETIPPRASAITVFSRAAGGLFVLGGTNPSTHAPLHDVWFQRLNGTWGEVGISGVTLGTVRAATYSFADQNLWVLDEVHADCRFANELRLLRIDTATGKPAAVAASWPGWRPLDGTFWLSVDHDGSLILTFSTRGSQDNIVSKIQFDHSVLRARTFDVISGDLVATPMVDDDGYAFVKKKRGDLLTIDRLKTLSPLREDRHHGGRGRDDCDFLRASWGR